MLRRIWLVFAQAATVALALLFVVSTLHPQWLAREPAAPRAADGGARHQQVAGPGIRQVAPDEPVTRVNALGSYADAAMRAMPAVVNVYTTKKVPRGSLERNGGQFTGEDFPDESRSISRLGSGVIATTDGYVLTNNHVVTAADSIKVALGDGRRVDARLVGADAETDLAVLRIDVPDLPVMTFGRSETLKVGDVVLAIGNPFDVGQTVTMGIVSALGRTIEDMDAPFDSFIQTDAAINEGNSGGALVDSNGQLVGINTAIYSRTGGSIGIGFAIPTNIVTQVMNQIVQNGRVRRGWFGVQLAEAESEGFDEGGHPARGAGVAVKSVNPEGPAGHAGVQPGDLIVAINGTPVGDQRTILTQIAQLDPGATARVHVVRHERELDVAIRVGERPLRRR